MNYNILTILLYACLACIPCGTRTIDLSLTIDNNKHEYIKGIISGEDIAVLSMEKVKGVIDKCTFSIYQDQGKYTIFIDIFTNSNRMVFLEAYADLSLDALNKLKEMITANFPNQSQIRIEHIENNTRFIPTYNYIIKILQEAFMTTYKGRVQFDPSWDKVKIEFRSIGNWFEEFKYKIRRFFRRFSDIE